MDAKTKTAELCKIVASKIVGGKIRESQLAEIGVQYRKGKTRVDITKARDLARAKLNTFGTEDQFEDWLALYLADVLKPIRAPKEEWPQ